MDAVEFIVTHDRMCKSFNGCCNCRKMYWIEEVEEDD